jgi:hypothetical protein
MPPSNKRSVEANAEETLERAPREGAPSRCPSLERSLARRELKRALSLGPSLPRSQWDRAGAQGCSPKAGGEDAQEYDTPRLLSPSNSAAQVRERACEQQERKAAYEQAGLGWQPGEQGGKARSKERRPAGMHSGGGRPPRSTAGSPHRTITADTEDPPTSGLLHHQTRGRRGRRHRAAAVWGMEKEEGAGSAQRCQSRRWGLMIRARGSRRFRFLTEAKGNFFDTRPGTKIEYWHVL